MSDLAWNIFGAVTAILGFLVSPLCSWIGSYFLTAKLDALKKLLKETKDLLALTRRHGLLVDAEEYCLINSKLWNASEMMDTASEVVCSQPGLVTNLRKMWSATSGEITVVIKDVTKVKAQLLRRTSAERRRLASSGKITDIPDIGEYEGGNTNMVSCSSSPSPGVPHDAIPRIDVHHSCLCRKNVCCIADTASDSSSHDDLQSALRHSRQLLSDDGLQDLVLSLVLTHPLLRKDERKRQRAKRRDTLTVLGRDLCTSPAPIPPSATGSVSYTKRRTRPYDSRLKALRVFLRRASSSNEPIRSDSGVALLDPESLPTALVDDDGDSSWLDQ
ncbi:hypothetical protein C8Q77DRAFT_1141253 [Trametes polyzona]|nr:hypothetical protein C8Q77DRAFT_1141253 [Trametes polyzona]